MTPTVGRLVFLFTAAFLIEKIAILIGHYSTFHLQLHFDGQFEIEQLFTHPFTHSSAGVAGFINFLFEIMILWSFGSELERVWGSYNFLRFFFIGLLGGALLSGVVGLLFLSGLVIHGFGAGLAAVLVAYAIIWSNRQALFFMVIPIRMKWLVVILFVFLALIAFSNNSYNLLISYSGGALAGALFLFYYARKGSIQSGLSYSASSSHQSPFQGIATFFENYKKQKRLKKKQREIQQRIDMQNEVDRLLGKISRDGMDSLSRKEKAFLDRASREL